MNIVDDLFDRISMLMIDLPSRYRNVSVLKSSRASESSTDKLLTSVYLTTVHHFDYALQASDKKFPQRSRTLGYAMIKSKQSC